MKVLFLDTETRVHEERFAHWIASHPVTAKKNLVKPELIEADIAAKTANLRREALTNDWTNAPSVMSLIFDDQPDDEIVTIVNSGLNEKEAMQTLASSLDEAHCVVAWNGAESDFPWIRAWLQFSGIRFPHVIKGGDAPWKMEERQFDPRRALTDNARFAPGRLSDWCRRAGVEGPNEHGPEEIERMNREKDWKGLKATCQDDVLALRRLHVAAGLQNWY